MSPREEKFQPLLSHFSLPFSPGVACVPGLDHSQQSWKCVPVPVHPTVSCLPSDFFTALFADFSSRSLFLFRFPGCPINLSDVFLHICTFTHVLTSTWSHLLLHLKTQKSPGLNPQGLTPEPIPLTYPLLLYFNQDTGFYILLHVECWHQVQAEMDEKILSVVVLFCFKLKKGLYHCYLFIIYLQQQDQLPEQRSHTQIPSSWTISTANAFTSVYLPETHC